MNKLLLEQMILEELILEATSQSIQPMDQDQYKYVGKDTVDDLYKPGDEFIVNSITRDGFVNLTGPSGQEVSIQWNNSGFLDFFKYIGPNSDRAEREKTYFTIMSTETRNLDDEGKSSLLNLIGQNLAMMNQADGYKYAKLEELANRLEGKSTSNPTSTEPAEKASTESTDDEYAQLAQELFPNIANRGETGIAQLKNAFKNVQAFEIEKKRRARLKINVSSKINNFDFNNDGTEDKEDKEIYSKALGDRRAAVTSNPKIPQVSLDDLLTAAAEEPATDDTSTSDEVDGEDTGEETDTDGAEKDTTVDDVTADPETVSGDIDDTEDTEQFVSNDKVKEQIAAMKGFYDKPYLYEQGKILRDMIRALQNAMKEEDRTKAVTKPVEESLQEAKGLNVKNIKVSLNTFLQQTRKVKKALDQYIEMAEQGRMGATRKKVILDKEVDRLIDYGKSIIKSLPKSINEAEENTSSEGGTDLQPLHDFVNFVLGDKLQAINKEDVRSEITKVQPVLKVFPNVAPFGQAQDLDIDLGDYSKKFQAAINDNLKTAIANFKSLQSGDGGEAAIKRLRTALITFLGTGLSILGKSVEGDDLDDLEASEAVNSEDNMASTNPSSAESIMSELGLDVGEQGKIQTTSDEEEAAEKLDVILNKLGTNKKYNTAKEISDFIYDQVKYERLSFGSVGKEGIKGVLRLMGLRKFISEAKEGEFDIEDFTQEFFTKIITMSTDYLSTKDKNKLRQASNELARASEQAFKQYQRLSKTDPQNSSRKITNTRKTITDMFSEMRNITSGNDKPTNALEMKYKKVFKHMQKNIGRLSYAAFINTLFKMEPSLLEQDSPLHDTTKEISSKIIERDNPVIKDKDNSAQKIISFEGLEESGEIVLLVPNENKEDFDENQTKRYFLEANYLDQGLKIEKASSETTNEQIERKLERIIESYINNRKKQWRKRTM